MNLGSRFAFAAGVLVGAALIAVGVIALQRSELPFRNWPGAENPGRAQPLITPAPNRGRTVSALTGNGGRNDVLGGAPLLGGSPLTPGAGGPSALGSPALPPLPA